MKRSSDSGVAGGKPSQRSRLEACGSNANEDDSMEGVVVRPKEEVKLRGSAEEVVEAKVVLDDGGGGDDEMVVVKVEPSDTHSKQASNRIPSAASSKEPSSSIQGPGPAAAGSTADNKSEEDSKPPPAPTLSYPRPKNFAERVMNALERGIASESVWWVGNGKAIGLHPNNLKKCPELTTYFKAKDYSGFIRNCNRWGFRRVAHHKVEPGIVTYENSLFQQDKPHLVKHMRMDSDVQDVFARHQSTSSSAATGESEADKAARIIAEAKALKGPTRVGRKIRGGGGADLNLTQKEGGGTVAMAAGAPLQQQQQPRGSQQATQLSAEVAAAALAALTGSSQGHQPTDESTLSKEFMLRKILQLADQFLDHPGSLYSDDAAFTTLMQLVRALGQQHQNDLLQKGHMATLLRLESSLKPPATATAPGQGPAPGHGPARGQGPAPGHGPAQGHCPAPNFGPATPAGMNPLQALLVRAQVQQQVTQQQHEQQQQHPPPPQPTAAPAAQPRQPPHVAAAGAASASTLIQNWLGKGGSQLQLRQQRQHQQATTPQGPTAANSMATAQTLQMFQQQQPIAAAAAAAASVAARTGGETNQDNTSSAGTADGGRQEPSPPQFTTAKELLMRVLKQQDHQH